MSTTVMAMLLGLAAAGCRLEAEAPPATEAPGPDDPTTQGQRLAPEFSLTSHDGHTVALDELVARGPAILVFYRGHW